MDEQNQSVAVEPKTDTVVPAPAEVKVEVVAAPVEMAPEVAPVEVAPVEMLPNETESDADFPVATPKTRKPRKPRTVKKGKKVVKKTTKKTSKLGRGHKICSHCGKPNGPRAFTCKHCGRKFKMNVEPKNRIIKVKKVRKYRKSKK